MRRYSNPNLPWAPPEPVDGELRWISVYFDPPGARNEDGTRRLRRAPRVAIFPSELL